jgi:hypothetical protein
MADAIDQGGVAPDGTAATGRVAALAYAVGVIGPPLLFGLRLYLRRIVPQLGLGLELDSALAALLQGHSATATARLAALDHRLASLAETDPQSSVALRARGRILGVCDALAQHGDYFDTGAPR